MISVEQLLNGIAETASKFQDAILIVGALAGLAFVVKSLFQCVNTARDPHGHGNQGGYWRALMSALIGVALVNLWLFTETGVETLFSEARTSALAYDTGSLGAGAGTATAAGNAVVAVFAVLGVIGIFRGLYRFKESAEGKGGGPQGFTFIAGGILCTNIGGIFEVIKATFGF